MACNLQQCTIGNSMTSVKDETTGCFRPSLYCGQNLIFSEFLFMKIHFHENKKTPSKDFIPFLNVLPMYLNEFMHLFTCTHHG